MTHPQRRSNAEYELMTAALGRGKLGIHCVVVEKLILGVTGWPEQLDGVAPNLEVPEWGGGLLRRLRWL